MDSFTSSFTTFLLQTDVNLTTIKQEQELEIKQEIKEEIIEEIIEENEKPLKPEKKYKLKGKHQNTYTCDICFKEFKRNFSLKIHKRIHFDEKPFKCELCPMHFNQKSNYTKHKLIHLNQKPHKCGKCDNSFSQKSHLINHQMQHAAENLKPYKCGYCESSFGTNNCLIKHVQILHFGREMFKCEFCGKIFVSKSGFKNHRKIHILAKDKSKNIRKRLDKFMTQSELEMRLQTTEIVKPKIIISPYNTTLQFNNKISPYQSPKTFTSTTKFGIPIDGTIHNLTKFGVPNAYSLEITEIKKEPELEIYELSD